MKFGIKWLFNDQIKVSKSQKAAMLVIGRETKPKFQPEQEFTGSNPFLEFGKMR